ncbi:MAG: hypothetical protein LBI33_05880 [Propionibacteriaceae bacterium]|jgi:hypothetical protein|nr:hypothetical protein [Propionibacteriaceae bacterium]
MVNEPVGKRAAATRAGDYQDLDAKSPRPSRARRPIVPVVLIALIALVILAALGYGGYRLFGPGSDSSAPAGPSTPAAAVQAYLDALAQGDATTALQYSATQPTDPTFTTNTFLTAAITANPLADIQVTDPGTSTSPVDVNATYTLGGTPVDAHFRVQKHDRTWLLDGGFLSLNLSQLLGKGVPLALNDVALDQASPKIDLFPGVYTFSSLNPMLTFPTPDITIAFPESAPTFTLSFALSPDGVSRLQAAAKTALDACLTRQELAPAGCGFGFASATGTPDPATITWTLGEGAPDITTLAPTLEANSTTQAYAQIAIPVHFHASNGAHIYNGDSSISAAKADFTDPDQIIVTFGQ